MRDVKEKTGRHFDQTASTYEQGHDGKFVKRMYEARKRLRGSATIQVGDAEELPYEDGAFDVVVYNASFHHYPNPSRVLRPGGVLILGDPMMSGRIIRAVSNYFLRFSNLFVVNATC